MSFKVFARFSSKASPGARDNLKANFTPDGRGVETTYMRRPDQSFAFVIDRILQSSTDGLEVYSHCAEFAAVGAIAGQNGAILAYGHGGSGKSSTMFGKEMEACDDGLLCRSCNAMFASGVEHISISIVEVFKETVRDLLCHSAGRGPPQPVRLRDTANQTIVEGAVEENLSSMEDLMRLLTTCKGAIQASKGHCVFMLRLSTGAKLYLARLADSDIGSNAKGAPAEALEARKWSNKSFNALGGCLKAVSDRARIVPVRDTVLTRLLRESLGQGCNISIVGHCTLSDDNGEETLSTLRFVHRLVRQTISKPQSASVKANGAPAVQSKGKPQAPIIDEADARISKTSPQASLNDSISRTSAVSSTKSCQSQQLSPDALASGSPACQSHPVQDELARAWTYAFHLENLIVWIAEVFQVGGYDPMKLEGMLLACCQQLQLHSTGSHSPQTAIQRLLDMHGNEELELPGGQNHMVNFRKNPVGDSPWAGELHQILLNNGILRKLVSTESTSILSAPLTQAHNLADDQGPASLKGKQTSATFDVPRVVTEDAKFLYLDGRIHELEEEAAGSSGDLDKFDLHIESLRKDVESALDHIDDELFANLVSRVSYLKMRREWERENSGSFAQAHKASAGTDHGPSQRHAHMYSSASSGGTAALLQELQSLKARGALGTQNRSKNDRSPDNYESSSKDMSHSDEQQNRRSSASSEERDHQVPQRDAGHSASRSKGEDREGGRRGGAAGDSGEGEGGKREEWSKPSSEEVNAGKLLDMLRESLNTHERRHQTKVYMKCFSGWQLVDWLVDKIDQENLTYVTKVWNCSIPPLSPGSKITREQASIIAQGLMNAQIFAHLGSAADFTDDDTLYRLVDGEELTVVLNRQILWAGNARSAVLVSHELLKQAISLAHSHGARDFASVQEFQHKTCELQMVNLIQLPVEELRCFFINIFNVLVLHARITTKGPIDENHIVPRCTFFRNTSYQVGKYFYSLDDICRGILRAKKCLFLDCDPRVHFALSYGTRHTPPARIFNAVTLDSELEAATRKFCSERVRVDVEEGEVSLPVLFEWYRKDFSSSVGGLLDWIAKYVPTSVAQNLMTVKERRDVQVLFE